MRRESVCVDQTSKQTHNKQQIHATARDRANNETVANRTRQRSASNQTEVKRMTRKTKGKAKAIGTQSGARQARRWQWNWEAFGTAVTTRSMRLATSTENTGARRWRRAPSVHPAERCRPSADTTTRCPKPCLLPRWRELSARAEGTRSEQLLAEHRRVVLDDDVALEHVLLRCSCTRMDEAVSGRRAQRTPHVSTSRRQVGKLVAPLRRIELAQEAHGADRIRARDALRQQRECVAIDSLACLLLAVVACVRKRHARRRVRGRGELQTHSDSDKK